MKAEMESVAGSPAGSLMSVSSATTPGTPGSGHYRLNSVSASNGYELSSSDSFDSDMENNNMFGHLATSLTTMISNEAKRFKAEPTDIETTPKKKRYTKSRVRNRSPSLVQKLKKTRRSKANDRERARMHNLNDALESLRKILPNSGDENKLTKIETLRFAYNYIFALRETLNVLDRGETIDETLFSSQMSAALKMPSACQTLSNLHQQQQQLQKQQHIHHHQQPAQLSPVGQQQQQLSPVNMQHHQQLSPVSSHQQLSPVMHHSQQYSNGIVLPQSQNNATVVKMEPVTSQQCRNMSSANENIYQNPCFTTGTTTMNQVQDFHVTVAQSQNYLLSSSSVPCYSQFSSPVPWVGAPRATNVFTFDHPHSPAGFSDTSEGYTFELV
ncbi:uncharacterized protein LOC132727874 [Ruditapes philippinarum]|uniref:uncharacterized protein LOC132727874 n=1 Tax=Ruditapes philippinarum TaxID=129788 RepID=UPI00295BD651|nr:uncharacterized protein LOC132727874 [Ruditapes philippinarum]